MQPVVMQPGLLSPRSEHSTSGPMGGAFQNEPKENTSESESHDKRLYLKKKTAPDFPSTPYMKISMKNCVFFEWIFSFKTSNTPT